MTSERVLFVDDDPRFLESSRRVLRGTYDIVTALGGAEGRRAVREQGPFGVVVAALRMPDLDGITLLRYVREIAPDTVCLLLAGYADTVAAIQSVNEGQVFRFLTKPCPGMVLRDALRDAVRQYRLESAERVLTEHTLPGSLRALVGAMSLVHPEVAARTSRVRRLAVDLATRLHARDAWRIEIAALFSHVGYLGMEPEQAARALAGQARGTAEAERAARAPELAAVLTAGIPRMEEVQDILLAQGTHWNGAHATVRGMREARIPLGARILRVAIDFDALTLRGTGSEAAIEAMAGAGGVYDPAVVDALRAVRGRRLPEPGTLAVRLADLAPGMVIAGDVRTAEGRLLVACGQEVTPQLVTHLRHRGDASSAATIVHVRFDDPEGWRAAA